MISVNEAKRILSEAARKASINTIKLPLRSLRRYVLAEDIRSRVDSPPFDQAAMDGYAYCAAEPCAEIKLIIQGENAAGKSRINKIQPAHCVQIFTGARMPLGADTVAMQEHVKVCPDNTVLVQPLLTAKGDNVRKKATQLRKGDVIIKKGSKLDPHTLALLASCGFASAKVYQKPKISIIVTGSELVPPGSRPGKDSIIETNSVMLRAALESDGFSDIDVYFIPDSSKQIKKCFLKCIERSQVVIFSGGMSVGKYDHVRNILDDAGTRTFFHRIKQKPGKPFYFGQHKKCFVFGLPGNPGASLTCLYEYVLPFVKRLSGEEDTFPAEVTARVSHAYIKKAGLTHFLKARMKNSSVEILGDQESFKISSFALANCLVCLPEEVSEVIKDERVLCHILPAYD